MSPPRARRIRPIALMAMLALLIGACGGSGDGDDTPDEASFCRLVARYSPVAEAPLAVLERLDELAPDEIDDAVVVLREAAEELAEHRPRSPELVEAEFEVRFRPEHIAARRQVETFATATCRPANTTTTTTTTTTTADS